MTAIQVVGIGLDGAAGLSVTTRQLVEEATILVGSPRHLAYFPNHPGDRILVQDFSSAIAQIQTVLPQIRQQPGAYLVFLASGDPLFFGVGRLLLQAFPASELTFHPHLSSIQLAFSCLKLPWQSAQIVSVHGRPLDQVIPLLQQGASPIALLTDLENTPAAIARLIASLQLPISYQFWVCEDLGGDTERVQQWSLSEIPSHTFAPLNIVVLVRETSPPQLDRTNLPRFGLPDDCFLGFADRPGLMTKREMRLLILGELALQPNQVVWDIGAGTGSVAIEIARLCPTSQIYAIEKTAAGQALIAQNCDRFQVTNVHLIPGNAPVVLADLPRPDRIFIGGSGGQLLSILATCQQHLQPQGVLVIALATLEHSVIVQHWLHQLAEAHPTWTAHWLQANLARSVPVASLTRWQPLNPLIMVTVTRQG
ncbi:precorrin-6y C5,15-methyltransferase (decarboxylating) subunit CbiE [Trichothermofontia sp.]